LNVVMLLANPFTNDARVYNEARALVGAGHRVTVIAWDRERENTPREVIDGIDVIRLSTGLGVRYGFASWLRNGLNLLLWQWKAYRRALALDRETGVDVVHCHDLDTLAIGAGLKRKLSISLIYDAHEIYGYMMARSVPRFVQRMIFWLEKRLVKRADSIINVGVHHRRYFQTITDKPILIVMNTKPLQSLEYQPSANEDFVLLYIGSLQQGRAVPLLVRAARELSGVRCLIGGIGRPGDVQYLEETCAKTSNVKFLGRIPLHEVIPMTMNADCVFMMVDPDDINNRAGLANKQFEAMVCGRPIICTRGTYSGEMTEEEEVGLAVEYSEEALREAIIRLRDDPALRERLGRNALKAAIDKYNWENEERKLLELYEGLAVTPDASLRGAAGDEAIS